MLTRVPRWWLLFGASVLLSAIGMTASPARAAMPRADTAEHALLDPPWLGSGVEKCQKASVPFLVRVGTGAILPFKGVTRSEVGDTEFAESCVAGDGLLHVTGRACGSTTITVWTDEGVATYPLSIN